MAIFNSYVKLPEGMVVEMLRPSFGLSPVGGLDRPFPRTTSTTTAGVGQLRGPWPSLSS